MVICLRCGYCCKGIWPGNRNDELETSEPCLQLDTRADGLCSCRIYPNRPKVCRDECMGASKGEFCTIGLLAVDKGTVPRPTGKCMNCGELTYDGSQFCCDACEKTVLEDLNSMPEPKSTRRMEWK